MTKMLRRNRENEEKNKLPNPKFSYVYESLFCRPNLIKYRHSEHRKNLNIFGNVHPKTGTEGPEGEERNRPTISLLSTLDVGG
jgi:hypothetical protein